MSQGRSLLEKIIERADKACPVCNPQTPRTDVSPPSRRSAVPSSQAGSTSAAPSAELDVIQRSRGLGDRRAAARELQQISSPDRSIDLARAVLLLTILGALVVAGLVVDQAIRAVS